MFLSSCSLRFRGRHVFAAFSFPFEPLEPTGYFGADPFIHGRRDQRTRFSERSRQIDRREDANTCEVALLRKGPDGLAAGVADPCDLSPASNRTLPGATSLRSASMTLREVL
jgi:hypothetical protein